MFIFVKQFKTINMKTHYLISRETKNYRKRMVMVTETATLELSYHKIELETSSDNIFEEEIGWWKRNLYYVDSDKATFDAFYIEIANELNSFNNKVTLETV